MGPMNWLGEEDRKRAVAGIADDQVVPAVAVQVGRDDLRRELAGGERPDPDEAAVAVGVERDGVVLGVDAGEQRAVDRCSGTQAMSREGIAGVDRDGRLEGAGLAGDALAIEDIAGPIDDQHIVGAVAVDVGHQGVGLGRDVGLSRRGECAIAVASPSCGPA